MSTVKLAIPKKKTSAYYKLISRAASYINQRDALFVMTGAGMSVDCGLPDLKQDEAFYNKMISKEKKLKHYQHISHNLFENYPEKFWYYYGDRYMRYKQSKHHEGYKIIKDICHNFKNK